MAQSGYFGLKLPVALICFAPGGFELLREGRGGVQFFVPLRLKPSLLCGLLFQLGLDAFDFGTAFAQFAFQLRAAPDRFRNRGLLGRQFALKLIAGLAKIGHFFIEPLGALGLFRFEIFGQRAKAVFKCLISVGFLV